MRTSASSTMRCETLEWIVQLPDDGNLRAHQISNRRQNVGLAVVDAFGHHGAVELQQDPVRRRRGLHQTQHPVQKAVQVSPGDRTAGKGLGENGRHQLEAVSFSRLDEPAGGNVDTPKLRDDLVRLKLPESLAEAPHGGGNGSESAGFVADGAGEDLHSISLPSSHDLSAADRNILVPRAICKFKIMIP